MKCPMCGDGTSVIETRRHDEYGYIYRRRRECVSCKNRFNTFEILDGIKQTLEKYLMGNARAVRKRCLTKERNEKIVRMLNEGEKVAVVANHFGITDNLVCKIAIRNNIAPYRERVKMVAQSPENCPRPE